MAAGAWAVIAVAVVVSGVILIVGMSLFYSYKTNGHQRAERF